MTVITESATIFRFTLRDFVVTQAVEAQHVTPDKVELCAVLGVTRYISEYYYFCGNKVI